MAGLPATHMELFAPSGRRDPHPAYHRVRAERPIWFDPANGEHLLTRYADCEAVLRDQRWSSNPEHLNAFPATDPRAGGVGDMTGLRTLLFLDPPDHTRLRRLVSKAFTPRTIERLRPRVEALTVELLDARVPGEPFDVMPGLAQPLPLLIICELMGVPVADRDQFHAWSPDASRLLDFGDLDEEMLTRGLMAMLQFVNYFNDLFDERRRQPGDDLISALVQIEEEGDVLTEEELRSIVVLLFVAGHETTTNLIGNGLVALMEQRSQWERLCADPSGLAAGAVEELLRFDGPVHLTGRFATCELEVAGQIIEPGRQVVTLLAAANRDPARFADPDRLDITRADNHHLTFSHGIHYCLGAALARLEGQVVFTELARRFPTMDLACAGEDLERREHFVLRGWKSVPVTLD